MTLKLGIVKSKSRNGESRNGESQKCKKALRNSHSCCISNCWTAQCTLVDSAGGWSVITWKSRMLKVGMVKVGSDLQKLDLRKSESDMKSRI